MNKQYIIINDTLNILNARSEIVYQFQKGERVEIEATTQWNWITRHGAVWFSQAKTEAQIAVEKQVAEHKRQLAYMLFTLAIATGRIQYR